MSDIVKGLEKILNTTSKQMEKKLVNLGKTIDEESKKLDLKSQIGHHERTIRQAYAKLGEAYFEQKINKKAMENEESLIEIIKSNKKIISLLNDQLAKF